MKKTEKDKLHQRVLDIVCGASGLKIRSIEILDLITLCNAMTALRSIFGENEFIYDLFDIVYLDNFSTVNDIVDFLWEQGVRA